MAGNTTRSEATQSFFVYVKDGNTGVIRRVAIPGDVQIGLEGRPAELQLFGRLSLASKTYAIDGVNKGKIGITNDDTVVALTLQETPLSGRITCTLPPAPRNGQIHFIKDFSGTAGTVPIDIVPSPGTTIDNTTVKTLVDPYGSLALIWLQGQWRMLVAGLGSSGGSGAPTNASYVTINSESSLTAERRLTGSANILMTDNGPGATVSLDLSQILGGGAGTFTYATVTVDSFGRVTSISNGATPSPGGASYITAQAESGLSNERVMSGGLGTVVNDNGTTFNVAINPSIVPLLNASNTFLQPNTFSSGLTGSLQRLPSGVTYLVGIGGITITTGSNGQVFISGSSGGSGGSGGSTATVDPNAAFVLTTLTGSVPSGRKLTAGPGVTVQDGGPGGNITIGVTPLSSQSALAYNGFCSGSLLFNATTWTDFHVVPSNFTDTIQNGITRSGSMFTVDQTGLYHFHSFFNVWSSGVEYYGFRLSGSNGTLLQRTSAANTGSGAPILQGIVQLDSGTTFKLQYCAKTSGGSPSTWNVNDPLDGENMRTGEISIFRIADPITVNQTVNQTVNTGATIGDTDWVTLFDVDFTTQPSSNFTTDSDSNSLAGYSWITQNMVNADSIGVVPGVGLVLDPNGNSSDQYTNVYTAPSIILPLSRALPEYRQEDYEIRLWGLIEVTGSNQNYEMIRIGLARYPFQNGSTTQFFNSVAKGYNNGSITWHDRFWVGTVTTVPSTLGNSTNAFCLHQKALTESDLFVAITSPTASFPQHPTSADGYKLSSHQREYGLFATPITGSSDLAVHAEVITVNTSNSFQATIRRLKLQYRKRLLTFSGSFGTTVNGSGSSGGGDPGASYLTITNTGSLTNERRLLAGYGLNLQDGGPNDAAILSFAGSLSGSGIAGINISGSGTPIAGNPYSNLNFTGAGVSVTPAGNGVATINIPGASGSPGGAGEVSASYVVLGLTSSLANERVLTAGAGITITDNGPNSTVVISTTAAQSALGSAYTGYTTASVWWNATGSWTPFTSATLGHFVDTIQRNVTRNGTEFTVHESGSYYFHASFNVYGNDAYVTLRLSGSSGIVLQRATYRSNPTDQTPATLDGVFDATPGSIWRLEYISSGTVFAWTASNPLSGGDNMRTGEVSMFRATAPTQEPTGGSGSDVSASYITISNTGSLPNERALTAGYGISIQDGGANDKVIISFTGNLSASGGGGGGGLPKQDHLAIVAGYQQVDQAVFQGIGAFEFNPTGPETMAPSGSTTYTAYFQPIVEIYPTGTIAEVRLYNLTTNAVVTNSTLTGSSLTPQRLRSLNLSGSLPAGSNLYEMQMRVTTAGGSNRATCKGAKLFVTWS